MRDPERIIRVLQEIAAFWVKHPDLRLAQIIGNACPGDPYYMEDEELVIAIRNMACPACRDRELISRCPQRGREENPLKIEPIELPPQINVGYCDIHHRSYVLSMGCPNCVTGGQGV